MQRSSSGFGPCVKKKNFHQPTTKQNFYNSLLTLTFSRFDSYYVIFHYINMNILPFIFLITTISGGAIIPFTCQTRLGATSSNVESPSTVSCLSDEILVSCGVSGTNDLEGTYIDPDEPNTCIVGTSSASWGVTAVANCCEFPEGSIISVNTITSEYQSNNQVVTECPSGTTLTGCQVNYQSGTTNNIRGSYPGPQQGTNTPPAQIGTEGINTENQCIAEARTEATNIRGGAQCLDTASNYVLGMNYIHEKSIYTLQN